MRYKRGRGKEGGGEWEEELIEFIEILPSYNLLIMRKWLRRELNIERKKKLNELKNKMNKM